ncbi:hypothetical protein BaRGS_00035123 [Batillaria attramentaria]|uniref:Uncharacterized protein n=1 Tax=Batillaria attramentaria TaxID=370345 RepID=A0ABD0JFF0_9CAEN
MGIDEYSTLLGGSSGYFAVFGAVCFMYVAWKVVKALVSCVVLFVGGWLGPAVDFKKSGRWAVVTGCTDGIGKSYAKLLAAKGMDVVLISRNPSKLAAQAAEIEQASNVKTKYIAADFTRTDIYDNIQNQLSGLDIGVLVNNVGMLHEYCPDYFCSLDNYQQHYMDLIHCNVMSNIMMTSIVLPGMLERKRGIIINVSSTSGLRPLPLFAAYSASKAFIICLSKALQLEYASQGVTIQTITPNIVSTKMSKNLYESSGLRGNALLDPSPDVFVRNALSSVGRAAVTEGYWAHKLQNFYVHGMPDSVMLKVLQGVRAKLQETLRKED